MVEISRTSLEILRWIVRDLFIGTQRDYVRSLWGYLRGLPETPLKDAEEIYRTSLRIPQGLSEVSLAIPRRAI